MPYRTMLDEIDKVILFHLGRNARVSSQEISSTLHGMGFTITDRAIRQRLQRLEKNKSILGYSAILNPSLASEKVNRTILVKFKFSKNITDGIDRLTKYLNESPFCIYSARLSGDFDWVCHFVFSSIEQYDLETNNFLNRFSDIISDLRSYESKATKSSPYVLFDEHATSEKKLQVYTILNSIKKHDNLNDRLQTIVESLVKYFNAKFARIWFYDKKSKMLILKYSAGKYKNIDGEFSRISQNSLKIGSIAKTKKPVVSNDVVHDPRIKYHEWAKKEKLKSFAGYPISYKGEVVAVLAIFSEKSFSPSDFEVLGIFSDQLSKELSGFFEAKDFLLI
jgi:DNA-binding Lrp family transcriptional regulator